jgi:hypothetical protein
MTKQVEKQAKRIADAIVEMVGRADGPVTLAQIEREVPGFKSEGAFGWQCYIEGQDEAVWSGMTEAGAAALWKILSERRVAVQYVSPQVYLREGRRLRIGECLPLGLVPAAAANFDTPHLFMRLSDTDLEMLRTIPGAPDRLRPLHATSVPPTPA